MADLPKTTVAVLPCPSEPGRFHDHLMREHGEPVTPTLVSAETYATKDAAREAGQQVLAQRRSETKKPDPA